MHRRIPTLAMVAVATIATPTCSHLSPYRAPGFTFPVDPPVAPAVYRILLVGDAGEPTAEDATLSAMRAWVNEAPERTLVTFLGDNAYPEGTDGRPPPRCGATTREPASGRAGHAGNGVVHPRQSRLGKWRRGRTGRSAGPRGVPAWPGALPLLGRLSWAGVAACARGRAARKNRRPGHSVVAA